MATNASVPPPGRVCRPPTTVSVDVVDPAIHTLPAASAAMPAALSSPVPPTKVQ